MIRNYLTTAWRNISRHRAYSIINISGLAIGMACAILILLWVQNELSYDRFHEKAQNIYRVTCNASDFKAAVNPAAMPAGLKAELPAVKDYVRLTHLTTTLFEAGDRKFQEKNTFYADASFFNIFSFPLVAGNKETAFQRPDAVMMTESMARKYFGKDNALGKTLKRDNGDLVIVTGIFADMKPNSHLQFDFLMPMSAVATKHQDLKTNT